MGNVGECSIAIVFEEMGERFLALRETFNAGAVDEEDVEPVVLVIVEEGNTATSRFEKVTILVFSAVDRFSVQARLPGYVDKADAKRSSSDGGRRTFGSGTRLGIVGRTRADLRCAWDLRVLCQRKNIVEREHERSSRERGEERATGPCQDGGSPSVAAMLKPALTSMATVREV